jgi:hypothetical protein
MHTINAEKVLFTQLGDEGVLFNVESNEYFSTNETLTKIVLGLQNHLTQTEIVENLLEEFDIDESTCQQSVHNAIQVLKEKGFID